MFPWSQATSPRRRRRLGLAALILSAALAAPGAATAGPVTPVPKLDLAQYLGQWRQIAAIPQWYEVFCASNTVANYSLGAGGTVRVVNRCFAPGGGQIATTGRARVLDATTNAQLQVTFANVGGSWIYPDSRPNYVVMGLADDYRWAVVGSPERSSAFVLSRSPALAAADRSTILAVLAANGFNACALQTTPQRGGLGVAQPFCR